MFDDIDGENVYNNKSKTDSALQAFHSVEHIAYGIVYSIHIMCAAAAADDDRCQNIENYRAEIAPLAAISYHTKEQLESLVL